MIPHPAIVDRTTTPAAVFDAALASWEAREAVDAGEDARVATTHVEAVADTGDAYTIIRRRPWHLSCLWCDFETSGHRTRAVALDSMSEHYADATGVTGWRVTA